MVDNSLTNSDISSLRRTYQQSGLHRSDLHPDPVKQFRCWFKEAIAGDLIEPNAMVLGTSNGIEPSSRTVLLKGFDRRGFVFFTNYSSRKSHEISIQPNVSLLFPWYGLERQVIIQGIAEKIGKVESLTYFNSRPLASRIGAWISEQSKVISSRKVLDMKYQEAKYLIENGEVPLPKTWGGFRVSALNYEFWQGREHRLHDRFRYRLLKTEGRKPRWCIERLAP